MERCCYTTWLFEMFMFIIFNSGSSSHKLRMRVIFLCVIWPWYKYPWKSPNSSSLWSNCLPIIFSVKMFQACFYIIIKLNPQLNGWDVMTSAQGSFAHCWIEMWRLWRPYVYSELIRTQLEMIWALGHCMLFSWKQPWENGYGVGINRWTWSATTFSVSLTIPCKL